MFGKNESEGPDLTKVQQAVQKAAGVGGVRNLTARSNGKQIEIHGVADSIGAKQNAMKAITASVGDVGLVNAIEVTRAVNQPATRAVNSSQPTTPLGMTSATETRARTHTVKKGETLSHIAQHYYGKASEYDKIFQANRDKVSDPDKVTEGMTLNIP